MYNILRLLKKTEINGVLLLKIIKFLFFPIFLSILLTKELY